ncbi:hypothetical protein DS906_15840 [Ruegeria sp. A3M17]|nr:hypothetical protein DS906_15840 [Ruegeria sp. A3M17]
MLPQRMAAIQVHDGNIRFAGNTFIDRETINFDCANPMPSQIALRFSWKAMKGLYSQLMGVG